MLQVMAIAAGGALGSVLRFWLSTVIYTGLGRAFPYGTLAVNMLGCFLMGILFTVFADRLTADGIVPAGILIGVLGGFTTFSSFSIETFNLIAEGAYNKALLYMFGSLLLCVGVTWIGAILGKQL